MSETEFDNTLKQLSDKVDNLSYENDKQTTKSSFFSFDINFKSPIFYYSIVPIILLILLIIFRPDFIKKEVKVNGNIYEKKVVYKKLFIAVIVLSVVVYFSIFIYNYTKKQKHLGEL